MIAVKNHQVLANILRVPFHPILIEILLELSVELSNTIFTSAYRQKSKGVHGTIPCRAVDLRSWILERPSATCDHINSQWQYDPSRPHLKCALHHAICPECGHDNRGIERNCDKCHAYTHHQWHIHLQVHPLTVKTKGEQNVISSTHHLNPNGVLVPNSLRSAPNT